jgi:hypothetical protein
MPLPSRLWKGAATGNSGRQARQMRSLAAHATSLAGVSPNAARSKGTEEEEVARRMLAGGDTATRLISEREAMKFKAIWKFKGRFQAGHASYAALSNTHTISRSDGATLQAALAWCDGR